MRNISGELLCELTKTRVILELIGFFTGKLLS